MAVEPSTAFEIFTDEIGPWWRSGPISWNYADRAVMGYVNFFSPAMQTFFPGGSQWFDTHHANIGYKNPHCPPINVVPSSYQVFSAGAPLGQYPCGAQGATLW